MALKYQALNGYVNTIEINGFTPLGNGVGSYTNFFKPSAEHQGFYLCGTTSSSGIGTLNAYGSASIPSSTTMTTSTQVITINGIKYQLTTANSFGFGSSSAYTGDITFKIKVVRASNDNIYTEEYTKTITCSSSKYVTISIPYSTAVTVGFFVETVY